MESIIHVEILKRATSVITTKELVALVKKEIHQLEKIKHGTQLNQFSNKVLSENVETIHFNDPEEENAPHVKLTELQNDYIPKDVDLKYHVYRLNTDGVQLESMETGDKDEGEQPVANHWILPSADFHGLWENLVYESSIKENLLSYMETTMLFSDCGVDTNVISWNRLVLLHGPPGTGKTSLCKALAHKLAIRMSHRYTHGQLVEINSHSLFSKYFSESGKLVVKMFDKIRELIEDSNAVVFVLIDEVESLTRARESSMSGSEPSDLIRAVNSVLTQIDQIRRYPNVMILTTSNITGAIDIAFLDRADIRQYIGLPSPHAIFKIYLSCLNELIKVKLLVARPSLDTLMFEKLRLEHNGCGDDITHETVQKLMALSRLSEGLSGRTLRRVPFLAHALHIKSRTATLNNFLNAMEAAIVAQKEENTTKS